jgi:hypothetical protein
VKEVWENENFILKKKIVDGIVFFLIIGSITNTNTQTNIYTGQLLKGAHRQTNKIK